MSARLVYLSAVSALVISACATSQENPNYKFTTKYKAATPHDTQLASHTYGSTSATVQPVTYSATTSTGSQPVVYSSASSSAQPVTYVSNQPAAPVVLQPANYSGSAQPQSVVYQSARMPSAIQGSSHARVDNNCLKRESRNEVIGSALGGAVGAFAGKKLVGGTTGTLLGAAVGGTAGYGLGDKSVNCDPIAAPVVQASTSVQSYQQPATYQSQTQYQQVQQRQHVQQPQTYTQYSQTQYGPTYASTTAPAAAPVVVQPQMPQAYTAPTDQAYGDTFGTPGYHAVMAAQGQAQAQPQAPAQTYLPAQAYLPVQPNSQAPQVTYAPQQPVYTPPQPAYQPAQIPAGTLQGNMHLVVEGNTVYSLSKQLCVEPAEIQQINGLDASFNIKLGQYLKMPASRC